MASVCAPLVAAFFMKSTAQSVDSMTEKSCPGHPVLFNGKANNLLGVESVVVLSLTCQPVVAPLIMLAASTLLGLGGSKSSLSTSTGSLLTRKTGGTERGLYDYL